MPLRADEELWRSFLVIVVAAAAAAPAVAAANVLTAATVEAEKAATAVKEKAGPYPGGPRASTPPGCASEVHCGRRAGTGGPR